MAFRELRKLDKELYLTTKINELAKQYRKAQKQLLAQLNKVDITEFQRYRTEAILKEVNEIVKTLNRDARKWVIKSTPYAYVRGIDVAAKRLKTLRVTPWVNYDAQIHTQAVNILADQITMDLLIANESIKKNMHRFIRLTQQRILEDKRISEMIAEGIIRGEARRTVSDRLLNEFRRQLGNEQFITINGRNYKPDKYSELVARTRTREASTQGTINTCLQYNNDLVQVSVHSNSCAYCMQFQGRVYSISGSHPEFPRLTEEPPYHPNCKCNLLPITQESLEERGYYDEIVRLSNSPLTKVDSFSRFEELLNV